jgi:hypothetical protein
MIKTLEEIHVLISVGLWNTDRPKKMKINTPSVPIYRACKILSFFQNVRRVRFFPFCPYVHPSAAELLLWQLRPSRQDWFPKKLDVMPIEQARRSSRIKTNHWVVVKEKMYATTSHHDLDRFPQVSDQIATNSELLPPWDMLEFGCGLWSMAQYKFWNSHGPFMPSRGWHQSLVPPC